MAIEWRHSQAVSHEQPDGEVCLMPDIRAEVPRIAVLEPHRYTIPVDVLRVAEAGLWPGATVTGRCGPARAHTFAALEPSMATHYSGWANYQQLLAGAIAPLDDDQLNLRAAPHLWSVRMIANHVVAARAWWFHSWMGEGGPEFDAMPDFDEGEESERRPAPEIVKWLEATWSLVDSCLRRWSETDLDARFQRPVPNAEGERPWRDRRYIIWHVAEHDLHHGGEISLSLGMHGIPAIDL